MGGVVSNQYHSSIPSNSTILNDLFGVYFSERQNNRSSLPINANDEIPNSDDLLKSMMANSDLFTFLSFELGQKRSRNYFNNNFYLDEHQDIILKESEYITTIELDNIDDSTPQHILDLFSKNSLFSSDSFMYYRIYADCLNAENISSIELLLIDPNHKIISLNMSSNSLTDESLHLSKDYLKNSNLSFINFSSNPICHLQSILDKAMPSSLLVLDLSYCEELQLTCGTFLSCPQIIKLTLDGCGITTTTATTTPRDNYGNGCYGNQQNNSISVDINNSLLSKITSTSIFYGLFSLKELSLKENQLQDINSLLGLLVLKPPPLSFSDPYLSSTNHSTTTPMAARDAMAYLSSSGITRLCIGENPLGESSIAYLKATKYLCDNISSLCFLDGKKVSSTKTPAGNLNLSISTAAQVQNIKKNNMAVNDGTNFDSSDVSIGDVAGLNSRQGKSIEAEFNAALKGEIDTSLVK